MEATKRWAVPAAQAGCAALALLLLIRSVAANDWLEGALLILCALAGATSLALLTRPRAAQPAASAQGAIPAPTLAASETTPDHALGDIVPFLEALPEAALLVDLNGRVAGSNQPARRQMRFEASGLRLSAILRHPEVLDAAQAAAEHGAARTVDYQVAANIEEHYRVYVAPIAWGPHSAALLVFHDQTSQIVTERMRADFVANASHELRTPVTSLSLMVEALTGPAREDRAAQERFLPLMAREIDRMRRLIDDLLSLSKIEINEHIRPSERTELSSIVREASEGFAPIATENSVRLIVEAESEHWIWGDRRQISQIVHNLIDNAIKYSPAGGEVRVEVSATAGREETLERCARRWPEAARVALITPPFSAEAHAYVRVTDQGPGIARRHLPRLSERFFRVEREAGAEKTGTGLGLAIVRHIMNRHRGGFVVESEPGRGSAFAVYFELAPLAAMADTS